MPTLWNIYHLSFFHSALTASTISASPGLTAQKAHPLARMRAPQQRTRTLTPAVKSDGVQYGTISPRCKTYENCMWDLISCLFSGRVLMQKVLGYCWSQYGKWRARRNLSSSFFSQRWIRESHLSTFDGRLSMAGTVWILGRDSLAIQRVDWHLLKT